MAGSEATVALMCADASADLPDDGRHSPDKLVQPVAVTRHADGVESAAMSTAKAGASIDTSALNTALPSLAHEHVQALRLFTHATCIGVRARSAARWRSRKLRLAASAVARHCSSIGRG